MKGNLWQSILIAGRNTQLLVELVRITSLSEEAREPGDQKHEETSIRNILALDFVCRCHSDFDLRDGFRAGRSAIAESSGP